LIAEIEVLVSIFPITAHYRRAWKPADLPKMSFCGIEADGFAWGESVLVCAGDGPLSSICTTPNFIFGAKSRCCRSSPEPAQYCHFNAGPQGRKAKWQTSAMGKTH
jgi:hypothetical protein